MRSARISRYALAVVSLLVLAMLLVPAIASGLDAAGTTLTVDQTTGGQPTRFTFSTLTSSGETVLGLDFVYPEGTDLASTTVDAVTLVGLARHNVQVEATSEGTILHLAFVPSVEPSSTLRVVMHGVVTPVTGGNLTIAGTYTSQAGTQKIPPLVVQQTAPSIPDRITYWLDRQPLVKVWNSVPILYGFFNPQVIIEAIPLLFVGWLLSLALIAVAYPAAIPIGLFTAFMKMSKIAPLRWIAAAYINVIRGTPLFLQIYIAFFGLPLVGIRLPDFPLGVFVLAFNSGAYLAEIFRAGIQSINKGQFEAASSLGMTYGQAMAYVIIPQTVRRVLPTMTSEFILLFKDTALLSAVGIFELMLFSKNSAANTGNVTPYTVAAAYYLIITIPLINWVGKLEHRLALSEGAQSANIKAKKRGPGWAAVGPEDEGADAKAVPAKMPDAPSGRS